MPHFSLANSAAAAAAKKAAPSSFSGRGHGKIESARRYLYERSSKRTAGAHLVEDRVTPELLGRLLDEHGGALALYAGQWTDAADDCVQEALIELARQSAVPASPVAWLYRVVRNRAISQYRSARRRERREKIAWRLRLGRAGSAEGDAAANRGSQEPEFDGQELAAALSGLPDELREAVVARTWGGLNFEQIAELAGCSTSTAHRRYEAGLAALRTRLQTLCHDHSKTTARIPSR